MPATVVIGAQWGDEGKGKVVDLLAERSDVVARYQGGNNAGHTIVAGDEVYKLNLVPVGDPLPRHALHHRQRHASSTRATSARRWPGSRSAACRSTRCASAATPT